MHNFCFRRTLASINEAKLCAHKSLCNTAVFFNHVYDLSCMLLTILTAHARGIKRTAFAMMAFIVP